MPCKFPALIIGFLAVIFPFAGARGDDFPSIKAKQPEVYGEVAGLAGRNPELGERLGREDVAKNGLAGEALCLALWNAAQECKWQLPDLTAKFPALCHLSGVVGMADADGEVPKLIFTRDGGASFQMIFIQWNFSETAVKPYLNKPRVNDWKLEEVDERSYLVLDCWERQLPGEKFQRREITRILIDGINFVVKERKVVRVPMPRFIDEAESADQDQTAPAPGKKLADSPEIKAKEPGIHDEVMGLAARQADLRRYLEKWDPGLLGLGSSNSSTFREVLLYAARESNWNQAELFKKFPNLCREGEVAGIADEGSNVPRLVFAWDDGQVFEMLCNDDREMKDDGKGVEIYQTEFPCDGKIQEIGGRSYLVLSRWARMQASAKSEFREIIYLLMNGGKFLKTRDEELDVPMPAQRGAWMRDAEKARLEAAVAATDTSGIA